MDWNENQVCPGFYPSSYGSSCKKNFCLILFCFLSIMMFPKQEGDWQETDKEKNKKRRSKQKRLSIFKYFCLLQMLCLLGIIIIFSDEKYFTFQAEQNSRRTTLFFCTLIPAHFMFRFDVSFFLLIVLIKKTSLPPPVLWIQIHRMWIRILNFGYHFLDEKKFNSWEETNYV